MVNKATGWEGSGTRPGNRSRARGNKTSEHTGIASPNLSEEQKSKKRAEGKGTVYWIDLGAEKDELFIRFAEFHGMERRDAAKALLGVAMGLLPPFFWEPSSEGGFTGAERTNLVRQVFPKGSGHTNRGPHAVWKGTHAAAMEEMRGAPGGIAWVGLLMEKEKERLRQVMEGKAKLGGREDLGLSYKETSPRRIRELEEELEEHHWKSEREYAEEQLRIIEQQERQWRVERGLILDGDYVNTKGVAGNPAMRKPVDRIRPEEKDVDPYKRERKANTAARTPPPRTRRRSVD